jgi:hypothetical protein
MIARLAWSYDPLEESSKALWPSPIFRGRAPKNGVQFLVKDSKKYAWTAAGVRSI